jgi:broad specificity phosphatase PhoE
MSILLIRHAQSTFNEFYDTNGIDPQHPDARLTKLGRMQARALSTKMSGRFMDLVLVSPLSRSVETGLLAFPNARIVASPMHRESLYSSCDVGRPRHELAHDFPGVDFSLVTDKWWHLENGSSVGPEPEEALQRRILIFNAFLRTLRGRNVAVVGHGTFFQRMTGRHLNNCEAVPWDPQIGACKIESGL